MMKEVIIHEHENFNLCSIKSVKKTYQDKGYLIWLINHLYTATGGYLFVEASRPYYGAPKIVNQLKANKSISNLYVKEPSLLECTFSYKKNIISDEVLYLLSEMWHNFEHRLFCFFADKDAPPPLTNVPWFHITATSTSFTMFKGAEEDVIWIGKSPELKFPKEITEMEAG